MPGFLDFLNTPAGQGLLSGVASYAAGARRGTPFNNLGRGLLGGVTGYAQANDDAIRLQQYNDAKKLRDLQYQQAVYNFDQEKQAQELYKNAFKPAVPEQTQSVIANPLNVTGPNAFQNLDQPLQFQNVTTPGKPASFDINSIISSGNPKAIALAKQYKDLNAKKVKDYKLFNDGKGGLFQIPLFEDGSAGPPIPYTPAVENKQVNLGDRVEFVNPYTASGELKIGQSPDNKATVGATIRGQNITAQTAADRLAFDKTKPDFVDGAFVYRPTAENPQGVILPTQNYAPPKGSIAAKTRDQTNVLNLVQEAEYLLPKATGSYVGKGRDALAGSVGIATEGSKASAQLKVLAANLILNAPRLEGPQSDRDTALYREAAAQIGDETIPIPVRQAALQTIKELNSQYGFAPAKKENSVLPSASDIDAEIARRRNKK